MNPVERSDNPDIEDETHDLPVGVGIKDLRKVFKVSNHITTDLCWSNFLVSYHLT